MANDKPTDKAKGRVKELVQKEGQLVKSDNKLKADKAAQRASTVDSAKAKVRDLVKKEGDLVKSDKALKASKTAAEPSTWSKVKDFASRNVAKGQRVMNEAGTATRAGLRTVRGRGGALGLLALGASAAMEAGHALDEHIAKKRSEEADKQAPKDNVSAGGPRRNAASVAAAEKSAPKTEAKASTAAKPAAAKPAAKAAPKSTSKPASRPTYPVYKKGSSKAASFRADFAAARKAGKTEFTWEGRRYNTKLKGK